MVSVALILQTVNGDAFFQHLLAVIFERPDGVLQTGDNPNQHVGHLARVFGRRLDAVKNDALGGVFDGVNNVVQSAGQGVNVFAVKGRDKSLIQLLDNLVGEQVAVVLDLFDLVGISDAVRSEERRVGKEGNA